MQTVPDTLTHERAVIFADYAETRAALQRAGRQVDLLALRDYLGEGRHVIEAFLYLAAAPPADQPAEAQPALQRLQQHGFLVRSHPGQSPLDGGGEADRRLGMALDVQDFVARVRPDIVVLVTGQSAFTPPVQRLRLQGVRVEVAATPASIAPGLMALANGFVDLTHIGTPVDPLPLPPEAPVAPQPEAAPQPVDPPAAAGLEWTADL